MKIDERTQNIFYFGTPDGSRTYEHDSGGELIMNYKLLIMNDIELILIIHASNISNFPLSFEKNFTFQNAEGL